MSKQILRSTIHQSFAKTVIGEVLSKTSRYYFAFGKTTPWNSNEEPDDAIDSFVYENQVRKDFIFAKEIQQNDVSLVVDRKNWISGVIYDDFDDYSTDNIAYSGATSIYASNFYVLTDDFNVYKCLYNNNKSPSIIKPSGTSNREFKTSDGYIWKYIYTIPTYLQNKFLSSTQMPVVDAVNLQYYSNGKLEKFTVDSRGSNYSENEQLVGTVHSDPTNYRKLITTDNLTYMLGVGDLFMVNNQVRTVENITSNYIIVQSDEFSLYVPNASSIYKLNTYLEVVGDGYSEKNPLIVSGVTITNGGYGYNTPEDIVVDFSEPDLSFGQKPIAHVELVGDAISKVIIDTNGYGYTKAPTITITGDGVGFTGRVQTTKSKAYIDPIIQTSTGEIVNVIVREGGIGYTDASIVVRRLDGSVGNSASISVDTNIGKINTQQANVELSAINGAIHVIKVRTIGIGYTQATVKVVGDGRGCEATPVISENGEISEINVNNIGSGYSWAEIVIETPDIPSIVCVADAIISPIGGHGSSAINELFARTIMFRTSLKTMNIQGMMIDQNIRQVSLLKNLKEFDSNLSFQNFEGYFTHKLTLNMTSKPSLGTIEINTIIKVYENAQSTNYVRAIVLARDSSSLLVKALDNVDESIRIGGVVKHPSQNVLYTISNLTKPTVDMQSGECIFIDNKNPFKPSPEQQITILSRLKV